MRTQMDSMNQQFMMFSMIPSKIPPPSHPPTAILASNAHPRVCLIRNRLPNPTSSHPTNINQRTKIIYPPYNNSTSTKPKQEVM